MKSYSAAAALLLLSGWLSGCRVVGPNYQRPAVTPPTAFKEPPPAGWENAQPADAAQRGAWWEVFQDAKLNELEPQVATANLELQAAQARYLQARALIRFYHADALPTVTAGPSITPQRNATNPIFNTPPQKYTEYVLPFDVTWEPDVWGRVSREVEQQRANAQASAADRDNMRLSLQAELAMDYFQARSLDAEAQILNMAVAAYQRALQLTQSRHQGGLVSEVDVAQAQTQLESTRAQAFDIEVQRTQFEHAIAVLIGKPPEGFSLAAAPLTEPPPVIPTGVPADLLQRRPDIAEAERQIAAANASIGVAKSAFYPAITLSASAGLQNTSIGNLFTLPSLFWSAGAAAVQTITSGGHRNALTEESLRAYDEQAALYRQTVLTAFQEVEDNLSALRILEEEANTEQAAVAAAENSLSLSNTRYQGGVTTYLEVITAQSSALTDERAAVEILGRRLTASVLLIKALGGGWAGIPVDRAASPQSP